MGILDAFKKGGFAGVGEELGFRIGLGSKIAELDDAKRSQVIKTLDTMNGQGTAGFTLGGFDKFLIAGVVAILGAVVISKAMK